MYSQLQSGKSVLVINIAGKGATSDYYQGGAL